MCIALCAMSRTHQRNGILLRCAKGPREVESTTHAAEKNATIN